MRNLTAKESHLVGGTSFHNHTVTATPNQIEALLGPGDGANDGEDKVNMEWACMTNSGKVFTIYDWKYYRPLEMNEPVEWYIGAADTRAAYEGRNELLEALGR